MKIKQKLLLLSLLTLLGSITAKAFVFDGIYYDILTNTTVQVSQQPATLSGIITIPATVTYDNVTYSVTKIRNIAFGNCFNITSITIPNSVTSIGPNAFSCCFSLTSITIPNSVTGIGQGAFNNCTSLTSIEIPYGVTSIENNTFDNCTSLTSIEIPNSVTSIGNGAFKYCTSLTSIKIPNSVTTIGNDAFTGCYFTQDKFINNTNLTSSNNWGAIICDEETTDGLLIKGNALVKCRPWATSVTVPNSVTSISFKAFRGYSGLTSVTIGNSVTSIEYEAFGECTGLFSIEIPNSVKSIDVQAFYGCTGLTSVIIGNSVTSIGNNAFLGCTNLTSIEIPNSVTSIGSSAFNGTAWYKNQPNGLLYAGKVAYQYKGTMPSNTNIAIKEGTTGIAGSAFYYCSGLTSITIPNSVTSIGDYAFQYCSGLTSIEIPNSVTSIGERAFSDCTGLTSVVSDIEEPFAFGYSAFYNIGSSCTLTVPYGTRDAYIAAGWTESVFKGGIVEAAAPEPESPNIVFADTNVKALCAANWDTNDDGELSEAEAAAVTSLGNVFIENETITSFNELQYFTGLTTIGRSAFKGCSSLTSITIPSSVNDIWGNSFKGCSNLAFIYVSPENPDFDSRNNCNAIIRTSTNKLITGCKNTIIPESVTTIDSEAFYGCTGLTTINIPSSITGIGDYAFYASGLTSVTIPASVTLIGPYTFGNCANLKSAVVRAQVIQYLAFQNSRLETLTIGKECTKIQRGNLASYYCYPFANLKQLDIEDGDDALNIEYYNYDDETLYSPFHESSLETIYVGRNITGSACTAWGGLFGDDTVMGSDDVKYNEKLTSLLIGDHVTKIPYKMCPSCIGLTSINIPNSVTSIGSDAFRGCTSLNSITIPNSVTSIGSGAFGGTAWYNNQPDGMVYAGKVAYKYKGTMPQNTEIVLEDGTLGIAESTFSNCSGLTSIVIPNSVTSIGTSAFNYCNYLTLVTVDIENPLSIEHQTFSNRANATLYVPYGCKTTYQAANYWKQFKEIIEMEAPPSNIDFADPAVKAICVANWDTNVDGELSQTEAAAVIDLGDVFKENQEITSFNEFQYFTGVKSIGDFAFYSCTGLTSIELPNSVTTIGGWMFEGCEGLTSLTIPSSVTHIDYLGSLPNLVKITVDKSNPVYDSRNNCNAIIETATNTLITGCIGTIIPKDVTSIGPAAFRGTWSLRSIVIPSNITSIGEKAFAHCFLDELISEIESPFVLGEEVVTYESKLFIPYGTRDAYIAAGWTEEIFKGGIYYYNTLVDDDLETNDVSSYVLLQGLDDREEVPVNIVTDPVNANNHCIAIQSLDNPNHHWDTQFFVKSSRALGKDNRFRLRMKVRAEKEAMSILEAHRSPGDHAFSIGDFNFTTDWVEHTWNGTVSADGIMSIAISMNDLPESAIYYLDDIELIESYPADQSSALEGMLALMQSTNVYTSEAYDIYLAHYEDCLAKNETGELAETVINPYAMHGWLSSNDFDDLLLSAWTIGGQQCKDFETPLYINTWSVEAEVDANSSGMHVPFFEYWTADENSLDANTLEATLTDLENGTYTVEALVRVRIKNGASAPAYGITMSVNGGDAVDVCNGKTCGDGDEFLFDTFTATGVVSDGTLRIAFNVADNNNISWLAFKNVKYEKKESNEVAVTDISQLDNAIYVVPIKACSGGKAQMVIRLKNANAVSAYNFDMVLPEGVTVAQNAQGKYIDALSDRHDDHSRTFNYKGNNTYSLAVLSGNSEELTGNDGAIRFVTLQVADNLANGLYAIEIKNASYSLPNGTTVTLPNTTSSITVDDYILGDVNGNGGIDIGDAVTIINYLVGKDSTTFIEQAADTNKNGGIDIGDAVTIVNYLVGKTAALSRQIDMDEDGLDPQ